MHHCKIDEGKSGICGVRKNEGGDLYTINYGKVIAMNLDPIEKKPLFHFIPASQSFSIATVGCNFRCKHCQNYDISQFHGGKKSIPGSDVSPEKVIEAAERSESESISYTYTEPTIFFEFAIDCARLARERGIKNVFVSNGYASPEAVKTIAPLLDGINIDLKGDDDFYRRICGAKQQPVLDTIRLMNDLGVWVEVTTLVIPSHNDSEEVLSGIADFIVSVDPAIPWHVSRFYPTYNMLDVPKTPLETLKRARDIGIERGLLFIYEGNVPGEGGENTQCPKCSELLIERQGYWIKKNILKEGFCPFCNTLIKGVWR
jgi:pyruvate formate lyase activating enzyme